MAIAEELHHERPDWELSVGLLAHAIRHEREEAFSPKHRWAMDWYYPVLAGVISGDEGRAHLAERFNTFMLDDKGIRCVSDRPWVTTAETCECAMAHLGVGEDAIAMQLFTAAQAQREDDGRYITGVVHPELTTFPEGERSTYSSAAVLLAAEAIEGSSPAAKLYADHSFLPAIIDVDASGRRAADTDVDQRARD